MTQLPYTKLGEAMRFAAEAHGNQMYGDKPYTFHLNQVYAVLHQEGCLEVPSLGPAAFLHDVLEDCEKVTRQTLLDEGFSEDIVQIVEFCTDESGRNRKERKEKTYARVKKLFEKTPSPLLWAALAVKLADRIANVEHAEGSLLKMYQREHTKFLDVYMVTPLMVAAEENNVPPPFVFNLWKRYVGALYAKSIS